ncbi:MAG TPA: hypothetical protein DIS79_07390 [Bacteroidetes bacterium]|nr:hypothetical protein [Bacteroidota bacterium]HRK03538.1 PD-(D/E)XK nuclease family protein [Chlorobiota bacterium]
MAAAARTIDDVVRAFDDENLTIIVPTATWKRPLAAARARRTGGGQPLTVETFTSFAAALCNEAGIVRTRLSTSDADFLLRCAAREEGLSLGTLGVTSRSISRWKAAGHSPRSLEGESERAPSAYMSRLLSDCARLWAAFEEKKRGTAATPIDTLTYAETIVSTLTARDIVVLALDNPTELELLLIEQMFRSEWNVALSTAWSSDTSHLRDVGKVVYERLCKVGATVTCQTEHPPAQRQTCVVMPKHPVDEARRAAAVVLDRLQNGDQLQSMAIVDLGDREAIRLFREVFDSVGITLTTDDTKPLASTRAATTVRAALDVLWYGWRRSDLEHLLYGGLLSDTGTDERALIRVARQHRLEGGKGADGWLQDLHERQAELEQLLESDDDQQRDILPLLRDLRRALNAVTSLRDKLGDSPTICSAHEVVDIIRENIVGRLGIRAAAFALAADADVEGLPCAEREAVLSLDALAERYGALSSLFNDRALPFSEHVTEFWESVVTTQVRIPDSRLDGLAVVTPAEGRLRRYSTIIVPSFREGVLPRPHREPIDDVIDRGRQQRDVRMMVDDIVTMSDVDGVTIISRAIEVDETPTLQSPFQHFVTHNSRAADESLVNIYTVDDVVLYDFETRTSEPRRQQNPDRQFVDVLGVATIETLISKPMGPSALDIAAQCPYKYYASRLLELDESHLVTDRLSALERGVLLHATIRRFFDTVRGHVVENISTSEDLLAARIELSEERRSEYLDILHNHFIELRTKYGTDHLFAPTEFRTYIGTPTRKGLLQRWLELEFKDQANSILRPALFEWPITTTLQTYDVLGNAVEIPVRIRVDRIDVAEHDGKIVIGVIDYKSTQNSVSSRSRILAGEATQMPIYLAAVRQSFADHGIRVEPVSAIYRTIGTSLRSADDPVTKIVLADTATPVLQPSRQWRDDLVNLPIGTQVDELVKTIVPAYTTATRRTYPVRPKPTACRYCSFASLCRIDSWGISP